MQIKLSELLTPLRPIFLWLVIYWVIFFCIFQSSVVIRFDSPLLNYLFFILFAIGVPVSLLWLAIKHLKKAWRWLIIFLALASTIPVFIVLLFTLLDLRSLSLNGTDKSFEKIYELTSDNTYYRLYRTNGGATTAFGLSLRKEKQLIMGLKLVWLIKGFSPAYQGRIERLSQDKMRLIFLGRGGEKEQIYDFKM